MTTAKVVEISDDNGVIFHTLPGGSGEWSDAGEELDDTIFGQTYQSQEVGMISWTGTANALYKGFAGYVAKIKQSGTSTAFTTEAMNLVSGLTYEITDGTKEVWDRAVTTVIWDNGAPVALANILTLDYVLGRVTFIAGYSVLGAITANSGSYLPMTIIGAASSFNLTQTAAAIDTSDFEKAQANGGFRTFTPGLRTVTLEVGGFDPADTVFRDLLIARNELIIEINPDGSGLSLARGFFRLSTRSQSGDIGALEEETKNFTLNVPENQDIVFNWKHDGASTLSTAVIKLLDAFLLETTPRVRYAPDGITEINLEGDVVITDVSLSSGLDAMNEFSVAWQGTGAAVHGT